MEPLEAKVHHALQAHMTLLRGDTATALSLLDSLAMAPGTGFESWSLEDPTPVTLLTRAEVRLAGGEWEAAMDAAGLFDHPEPLAFIFFLKRSLAIRAEAARALGYLDPGEEFENRIALMQIDGVHPPHPITGTGS